MSKSLTHKTVKISFEGKNLEELANGQDIDHSENNGPRASSAPLLRLFSIIFKHVYWYVQQISGERLQDHWSTGCICGNKAADQLCSIIPLLLKILNPKFRVSCFLF